MIWVVLVLLWIDYSIYYNNAPKPIATFTPSQIDAELYKASEIGKAVTPDAVCGVAVEKISYQSNERGLHPTLGWR